MTRPFTALHLRHVVPMKSSLKHFLCLPAMGRFILQDTAVDTFVLGLNLHTIHNLRGRTGWLKISPLGMKEVQKNFCFGS